MLKNWFRKVGLATLGCVAATALVAAPSANADTSQRSDYQFVNQGDRTLVLAVVVRSTNARRCLRASPGGKVLVTISHARNDTIDWAVRVNTCDKSAPVIKSGSDFHSYGSSVRIVAS